MSSTEELIYEYPEIQDQLSETKPSNLCPSCKKPLDNHGLRTREVFCPLYEGDLVGSRQVDDSQFDHFFPTQN